MKNRRKRRYIYLSKKKSLQCITILLKIIFLLKVKLFQYTVHTLTQMIFYSSTEIIKKPALNKTCVILETRTKYLLTLLSLLRLVMKKNCIEI